MTDRHDLVEPEGVNAESADGTAEGSTGTPEAGDVRAGGDPDAAPPARQDDEQRAEDEMVGPAGTDPADPGQFAAPPGHDSGSAG